MVADHVTRTDVSLLIVDESFDDRKSIDRVLRLDLDAKLTVYEASSVLDGLRLFRMHHPDCILIAQRLSDGEGIDLLRMIAEIQGSDPAPVVYLASRDSERLAIRAMKAGALEFLSKSLLTPEALWQAIDNVKRRVALAQQESGRQKQLQSKHRNLVRDYEALCEINRRIEHLMGAMPTLLYVFDVIENRIVFSNPGMLPVLGYSSDEFIDMGKGGVRSLVHEDDLELYDSQLELMRNAADTQHHEAEYRMQHQDGSWRWVRTRERVFARGDDRKVWQVFGAAEDITERRQKEQAATELQNELKERVDRLESQLANPMRALIEVPVKGQDPGAEQELTTRLRESEQRWRESLERLLQSDEKRRLLSEQLREREDELWSQTTSVRKLGDTLEKTLRAQKDAEAKVGVLDASLATAQERLRHVEDTLAAQQLAVAPSQSEEEIERLRQTHQSEMEIALANLARAEEQAASAANELGAVNERLAELIGSVETGQERIAELEMQAALVVDEAERLAQTLERLEGDHATAIEETVALRAAIEAKDAEAIDLRRNQERLERELRETLDQVHQAANQRDAATSERKAVEGEIAERDAKLSRLLEQVTDSERAVISLQGELGLARAASVEAEAQNAQLTGILAEAKAREAETNANLGAAEELAETLRKQLEADSASRSELERQIGEYAVQGEDLRQLRLRAAELEGKLVEADERSGRTSELEAGLAAAEERLRQGEERWWATYKELQEKQDGEDRLRAELAAADNRAKALSEELEAATAGRAQSEAKLHEWQSQMPESEKQLRDVVGQFDHTTRELEETRGLLGGAEASLREWEARGTKSEAELASARSQVTELTARRDELTTLLSSAQAEATEQRKRADTAERGLAEAHEALERKRAEVQELIQRLAAAEADLASTRDRLQSVEASLAHTQELLDRSEQERADAMANLEAARNDIRTLRDQLDRSEAERRDAQDRLQESEERLRSAVLQLRQSEERFRALSMAMPSALLNANHLGLIESAGAPWEEYTGIPIVTAQQSGWTTVLSDEDREPMRVQWQNGISSRKPFSMQFRLRKKDGTYRWHEFRLSPIRDDQGNVDRWTGTVSEVHDQVMLRESHRQMRLRYSAVLDHTSEFLMFLSPTGLVLGASKSALAPLGQSMEFVVGQQWWETRWWPKAQRTVLMDGVRRASVGEVAKLSTSRYDADGQIVPVVVKIVPVRDENGQVALLLPTVHDV